MAFSRRDFLKWLGIGAGATIIATSPAVFGGEGHWVTQTTTSSPYAKTYYIRASMQPSIGSRWVVE